MPYSPSIALDEHDRAIYAWQLDVPGFGEAGQQRLKEASVLVSRCGGLGGIVALELAAAGIGKLVLAHAGEFKPSDFNRQVLATYSELGNSRIEAQARRLREFNPRCEIVPVPENVSEENAERLVGQVDLVVDCAPLFEERLAMNRQCVVQGKPLIECAMYELETQITTILPGRTACLRCRVPQPPASWQRRFPVFGAVSGMVGCLGAMEAIKVLSGLGEVLAGTLLVGDLRDMTFRRIKLQRDPACPVCSTVIHAT